MRQPRNSLNKDTAEKPYNSENFDIMRKTTTNKQIEDIGGVTRHSEFEKPYKLNWNEDYGNMQNLHPSNYDFSFLDTSSPNFENNIPNIPSGGIGDKDICIELLSSCQSEGMFGTACGKAMAAGCLKVIGDCMFYNWNGENSYSEAECFCKCCSGSACNEQVSGECAKAFCDVCSCPSFTLEGSDTAPTTLQISGSAACIKSVTGGQWSPGSSTIYVPDIGCGTKQVCVVDMCGNQMCKEVRMTSGTWILILFECPNYEFWPCSYSGYNWWFTSTDSCFYDSGKYRYRATVSTDVRLYPYQDPLANACFCTKTQFCPNCIHCYMGGEVPSFVIVMSYSQYEWRCY